MHLRYDDIVEELRKAVEVRGADYVYPMKWQIDRLCQYVYEGQPACIVGQVLHQLGFDLIPLRYFSGDAVEAFGMVAPLGSEMDGDAIQLLQQAQIHQDTSRPWGESVALAIQETACRVDC